MPCELLLATCLTIHGPGAIGYSAVLDDVAARRAYAGWGLTADYHGFDVLVAPADCRLLGKSGWLIANGDVYSAIAVDCEQRAHRGQMAERGLLADASVKGLNHQRGWLVLR